MNEVFDFYIKQISRTYPSVSSSLCRIEDVRVLRFPGRTVNDVILYRIGVQVQAGGAFTRLTSKIVSDGDWFGFIRKPTPIETKPLLQMCHRHFLGRVLNNEVSYSLGEYFSLYKQETLKSELLVAHDGRELEYWDRMLVRALTLGDDGYRERTFGSVKLRQPWAPGQPEPVEPYRTGVIWNFPVTEATLTGVEKGVRTYGRHPKVFDRAQPMRNTTLPIYHTRQPEYQ